jgi:hypothetical protein
MFRNIGIAATLAAASVLAHGQAGTRYQATYLEFSKGWGSIVADFDRDGHDEIYVTGHDRDDRIWYWTPSGYLPGPQVLPYVDRHACAAADVNRDGMLDFFCEIGAEKGTGATTKELWMQDAGGVFTRAVGFGAEDVYGRGRYPVFFDFNHDGWPDLYLTNESTIRVDGHPNINHVFINQAGNGFVEQTTIATGGLGFQCAHKGDIDGDGWDDLVVCGNKEGSHLFLNNRHGDFTEVPSPAAAVTWNDAQLVDMNGDGRQDLVLVNSRQMLQIWLNTGTSPYFVSPSLNTPLAGGGVSLAVGDFDGNGRKDVYVVLEDAACQTTLLDLAPDFVFWGQADGSYVAEQQPQAGYPGCGHLADTVDGNKILLEQGGPGWKAPNYLIRWK